MSTAKASEARRRMIAVLKGGYVVGVYPSVKRCSEELKIPHSRISEYAKSGRIYKGGFEFLYLWRKK